jgi:hypothetical protein
VKEYASLTSPPLFSRTVTGSSCLYLFSSTGTSPPVLPLPSYVTVNLYLDGQDTNKVIAARHVRKIVTAFITAAPLLLSVNSLGEPEFKCNRYEEKFFLYFLYETIPEKIDILMFLMKQHADG